MRFASFITGSRETYGVLAGGSLREPDDDIRSQCPDLRSAIAAGKLAEIESSASGATHSIASVQILPLIPNP